MPDLLTQLSDYGRQLDDGTPPLEAFVTRVPTRSPRRLVRRPWVIAIGAAVGVLLLIGVPLLIPGFWSTTPPAHEPTVPTVPPSIASTSTAATVAPTTMAITSEPGDVFTWQDDLSEWVTETEMTVALEVLSMRYYQDSGGGDLGGEAALARPGRGGEYVWAVGHWSAGVHAGGGWHPTPDKTDPRLPPGVKYVDIGQSYVFTGPNSSAAICLTVTTPGTTASIEEEPNYTAIVFEIATMMLEEMGWLD